MVSISPCLALLPSPRTPSLPHLVEQRIFSSRPPCQDSTNRGIALKRTVWNAYSAPNPFKAL